ncbi:MAG TPA: ABC transporter substrate-binding protein, partial [Steroidobacteraceae bacterium]
MSARVYRHLTTTVASRRRFLQWGCIATAASLLPACGAEQPTRVGVQTWAGFQFLTLAQRRGLYRGQPLELVPFETSDGTASALRTGQLHAATVTLDEAIRLRADGARVQVVLICDVSAGADVVLARPGIATLADLRGRRIGVESTALGTLMLAETLHAAGLDDRAIVAVPIEEDHHRAWQRGDLDAVLTYGLSAELLEAAGLVRLADSRNLRQVIFDVVAVRDDVGSAHGRALRTLVAGHFAATDLWRHNPIDTSYELAPLLDTTPERVRQAFKGVDLPDARDNHRRLKSPATELTSTARQVSEVLVGAGLLGHVPDLGDFF